MRQKVVKLDLRTASSSKIQSQEQINNMATTVLSKTKISSCDPAGDFSKDKCVCRGRKPFRDSVPTDPVFL